MNSTLFQIGVAIAMVAVIFTLLAWFLKHWRARSERRLLGMLKRAGVDPEIATRGDTEAIINDVRNRCQKCMSEDLCERWLAGEVEGENTFCPNARIFGILKRPGGHTA